MSNSEKTDPRFLNLSALPEGFQLRDFVIKKRIGKGGFGVVYLAERGRRQYAVKFPLLDLSSMNDEERAAAFAELPRIDREISTLKSLSHPNIISISEFFQWDPQTNEIGADDALPVIVMPFVSGPSLGSWVEKEKPSLRTIVRALRDLASALGEVHKRNFVHRDLKPENILVAAGERPVLIDFGIAKGRSTRTMTELGNVIGTADYLPPEYVTYTMTRDFRAGKPFVYGPAQDIYALGHTFYRVLTGVSAWAQYSEVLSSSHHSMSIEFVEIIKSGIIPPLSSVNERVPRELDSLVLRMMSRKMDQRFASAAELMEAVESLNSSMPIPHAKLDDPFEVPPKDEALRRAKDSSKKLLTAPLPNPADGSVEISLSGLSAPDAPATRTTNVRAPSSTANVKSAADAPPASRKLGALPSPTAAAPANAGGSTSAFAVPTSARQAPAFESPAPKAVGASDTDLEPPLEVPAELERLRQGLVSGAAPKTNPVLIGGLVAVVLVLLVVLFATSGGQPVQQQPVSLLDESEKEASKTPAPAPQPLPVLDAPPPANEPPTTTPVVEQSPLVAKKTGGGRGGNADAKAVDELLANEYGGTRPVVGKSAPAATEQLPAFGTRVTRGGQQVALGQKRLGVAMGSEISVKLVRPLDSRAQPVIVVAKLARPLTRAGEILLPTGTMVYGSASPGTGRFDVTLSRLKLPNGEEIPFAGIAWDSADKKPGLVPSRKISSSSSQSNPNVAGQIAKDTANIALGKVSVGGDVGDIAKGAAGSGINAIGNKNAMGGGQDALLLDTPADFIVFVTEAF